MWASPGFWCAARWINVLVEKYAWLSAGLIWFPEVPETGHPPKLEDHSREASQLPLESMSVISLFEFWEEGVQLVRALDAHHFNLPRSISVMNPWNYESKALSLSEFLGAPENSLTKGCHFPDSVSAQNCIVLTKFRPKLHRWNLSRDFPKFEGKCLRISLNPTLSNLGIFSSKNPTFHTFKFRDFSPNFMFLQWGNPPKF